MYFRHLSNTQSPKNKIRKTQYINYTKFSDKSLQIRQFFCHFFAFFVNKDTVNHFSFVLFSRNKLFFPKNLQITL